MEVVNKEDVIREIRQAYGDSEKNGLEHAINKLPTIDISQQDHTVTMTSEKYIALMDKLEALESRPTGKWIARKNVRRISNTAMEYFIEEYECSNCHCVTEDTNEPPRYRFCPNCGADMRGE